MIYKEGRECCTQTGCHMLKLLKPLHKNTLIYAYIIGYRMMMIEMGLPPLGPRQKWKRKIRKRRSRLTDLMVFGLTATIHWQSDSPFVPLV